MVLWLCYLLEIDNEIFMEKNDMIILGLLQNNIK